jgi:uncharacterized membrane protein
MLRAMAPENRSTLTPARESRERVIAVLSDHFAHDVLDVDEFERRITRARTSESPRRPRAIADLRLISRIARAVAHPDAAEQHVGRERRQLRRHLLGRLPRIDAAGPRRQTIGRH